MAASLEHTTMTTLGTNHGKHNIMIENTKSTRFLNGTAMEVEKEGIISDDLKLVFEIMNYVVLTGLISFCGMITNIINLVVFVRQGLTDSVSISLLGLAISDFGSSATHFWMTICINPLFANSGIPLNSPTIQYITAGWPHVICTRITCYITAYITLERCLCIVIPLKVKNIITPRRSFFVIITIYILMTASVAPAFYAIRLGWVFNEEKNRSLIDLVYAPDGVPIENVILLVSAISQLTAFILVIVCSLFLVNRLREKTKWRQKSSTAGDNNSSTRDNKVVKMVVIVATVFIICYLPSTTNHVIMTTSEEYSILGRYKNMFHTVWSFLNMLEAVNSAVNIFIYYNMSTKYRQEFRKLFCFSPEEDN